MSTLLFQIVFIPNLLSLVPFFEGAGRSFPRLLVFGFDLFHNQRNIFLEPNVSSHQTPPKTDSPKLYQFSALLGLHALMCTHTHTHTLICISWSSGSGSRQHKPIPLPLSANKWPPAGRKKGTVRSALNHFQLIPLPSSLLEGTVFSWGVCAWRGPLWHRWRTDIDLLSSRTMFMAVGPHSQTCWHWGGRGESLIKSLSTSPRVRNANKY